MADMFGANIEMLKGLAGKLDGTWAGELENLISTISGEVANSADIWKGPDADQFRGGIWEGHRADLMKAVNALTEAGVMARRQAEAQEATSNAI